MWLNVYVDANTGMVANSLSHTNSNSGRHHDDRRYDDGNKSIGLNLLPTCPLKVTNVHLVVFVTIQSVNSTTINNNNNCQYQ